MPVKGRVEIDLDKNKLRENAMQNIEKDEMVIQGETAIKEQEPGKVIFLCRGTGLTVGLPTTRRNERRLMGDGTEQVIHHPCKKLIFNNGYAETNDKEIIEAIQKERGWKIDFYWHPRSCPPDGDMKVANSLLDLQHSLIKERQERIEKARTFDKLAHPEDGVENPIDRETGEPSDVAGW